MKQEFGIFRQRSKLNFKQQIAKYMTGNIPIDQLPKLAVNALEEGLDTKALRILAGLDSNNGSYQIEHYFKLSLEELMIKIPDKRQAALDYACAIAEEIFDGQKEIIQGIREIKWDALDSYDFFSESKEFYFDSICFHTVYGIYDTCDNLSHKQKQWQEEKTNEELMIELKSELMLELKNWYDKMNKSQK